MRPATPLPLVLRALLAAVVMTAALLTLPIGAAHAADAASLRAGQQLFAGQQLASPSGRYRAVMQNDGNLVVYAPDGRVLAATGTYGSGNRLAMQTDGNLVVYRADGRALWDTRTWGVQGAHLEMQDNGDLVVWAGDGRAVWSTGWDTPDRLRAGQQLFAGQHVVSGNGRNEMAMQDDGNLVFYGAGHRVLSATSTYARGSWVTMQGDGNLVVYAPGGRPVWDSRTWGSGAASLVARDDGNFVLYRSDGGVAWATPFPVPVAAGGATQVVTVVAGSAASTTASLTAWELRAGGWTPVLGPVTAWVGGQGIGAASETSSRTPAGTFSLTEAFGRQGNPGTALPYRVLDPQDWWVSDTGSALYNQHTRCAAGTCPFREAAGENLWSTGWVYDHAVVIDYNRSPVVRGAGSAFFLHVTNGAPTAGCVAIDDDSLTRLLRWFSPSAGPLISIGTR